MTIPELKPLVYKKNFKSSVGSDSGANYKYDPGSGQHFRVFLDETNPDGAPGYPSVDASRVHE